MATHETLLEIAIRLQPKSSIGLMQTSKAHPKTDDEADALRRTELLTRWLAHTGVHGTAGDKISEKDRESRFVAELLQCESEDQARKFVSAARSRADDSPVKLELVFGVLLKQAVDAALAHDPTAEYFASWLLLVGEFDLEHKLTAAHAQYFAGVTSRSSHEPFARALELYEIYSAPAILQSIAALALAEGYAHQDDATRARSTFDRASDTASHAANSDWSAIVQATRSAWQTRWDYLEALTVDPVITANDSITDWDTWSVLRTRAITLLARQHIAEAIVAANASDRLAAQLGEATSTLLTLCGGAIVYKRFEDAERVARAALARDSHWIEARLRLAAALEGRGAFAEAQAQLDFVVGAAPQLASAHTQRAGLLIQVRRLDDALTALGTAMTLDPADGTPRTLFKWLCPREVPGVHFDPATGQLSVAQELFDAGPELAAIHMTAALVRGNPTEATKILTSVDREKDAAFAEAVRRLVFPTFMQESKLHPSHLATAERLFGERKFEEALQEYRLATLEEPGNHLAWMGAGDCHYSLGKFNLAVAFFEESLEVGRYASTCLFLGDSHLKKGRLKKALEAYESALEIDPNYALALGRVAELKRRGMHAE